jgi:hypothetical protein
MTLQTSSPEFLDSCRVAMQAEQSKSLLETANWSHVDRPQIHQEWGQLYAELAPLIDNADPAAPHIQAMVERHFALVSRFYEPSPLAYVGMALFYQENADMRSFHNGFHPKMTEFLGEAIFIFASHQVAEQ